MSKSVSGLVSRTKSRIRETDWIVTGKLLEAYESSLVRRHIFLDSVSVARMSIEVLVSTSVSPLWACIKLLTELVLLF
jgi:hypothetical protein